MNVNSNESSYEFTRTNRIYWGFQCGYISSALTVECIRMSLTSSKYFIFVWNPSFDIPSLLLWYKLSTILCLQFFESVSNNNWQWIWTLIYLPWFILILSAKINKNIQDIIFHSTRLINFISNYTYEVSKIWFLLFWVYLSDIIINICYEPDRVSSTIRISSSFSKTSTISFRK